MMRCATCDRPFLRMGQNPVPVVMRMKQRMSAFHELCIGCGIPTAKEMLENGLCKEDCAKSPTRAAAVTPLSLVG